jgi:3-oxoacyl-[acyl-carrier protein] reductase
LLGAGATVIVVSRYQLSGEDITTRLEGKPEHSRLTSHSLDLRSHHASEEIRKLLESYPPIAGLVSTVGSGRPTKGSPLERLNDSLSLNLATAVNCLEGAIGSLTSELPGSAVFVTSIAANEYIQCPPEYAAAKSALSSLIRHWASIYAPVRINSVAPGNVRTEGSIWDIREREAPERLEEFLNREVPLGRLAKPEEIAGPVHFLLSKGASFITGECVVVDGGQRRAH